MNARTHSRRRRALATVAVIATVAAGAAIVSLVGGDSTTSTAAPVISGIGIELDSDGSVPDGVTVFDDDVPAVANLDPSLLDALRRAAIAARSDEVEFVVNSGWRSAEYQAQLLRDAVTEYGSAAEAARWVATPETSPHVTGDAVDIGPLTATDWLAQHGAEFGLCQIYANELWHYELRDTDADGHCPATYADPTVDPRMQQ